MPRNRSIFEFQIIKKAGFEICDYFYIVHIAVDGKMVFKVDDYLDVFL